MPGSTATAAVAVRASSRPARDTIAAATSSPSPAAPTTSGAKRAVSSTTRREVYRRSGSPSTGPKRATASADSAVGAPRPSTARSTAAMPARPMAKALPSSPYRWPQPSTRCTTAAAASTARQLTPVPPVSATPYPSGSAPACAVTLSAQSTTSPADMRRATPAASASRSSTVDGRPVSPRTTRSTGPPWPSRVHAARTEPSVTETGSPSW
nr:hypothetical protein [Phytohabitans houttuyneae]